MKKKLYFIVIFLVFLLSISAYSFSFKFSLFNPFLNLKNQVSYGSAQWPSGTSWTVPAGVHYIKVISYGGGGSGASCWWGGQTGATGGGAGAFTTQTLLVSSGSTISISNGSGGAAVVSCYRNGSGCSATAGFSDGNAGGTTTVTVGSTNIVATGGAAGKCASGLALPSYWSVPYTGGGNNGASVVSYTGGSSYTSATFSGGQGGVNGNGGDAYLLTNYTTGAGILSGSASSTGTALSGANFSGAGGGAAFGPQTSGGANSIVSGSGGSGGAIIMY